MKAKKIGTVMVDFKKAFDLVENNLLLEKKLNTLNVAIILFRQWNYI